VSFTTRCPSQKGLMMVRNSPWHDYGGDKSHITVNYQIRVHENMTSFVSSDASLCTIRD